jgi:type IV secretory pathway TrbD component
MSAIHASLYRPVLFAGVEPAVAIAEGSAVLGLVFVAGVHVATLALAALYLVVVHACMARATAADPAIAAVYLRSLATRDYYPPHAHPLAAPPRVSASRP